MFGLEFISKEKNISIEDIKSFEVKHKLVFPTDLRNLLLIHNGGDLEVNSFFRLTENATYHTSAVERIASLDYIDNLLHNLIDDEEFINSQILPFAEFLGPGLVGIGIGANTAGKIYVFDWDYGLTYQAGSLLEFFKQLVFEDTTAVRSSILPDEKQVKWKI